MGCDIHCYIEYKKNEGGWRDFGGRINPGRNYWMFGAMAGVRSDKFPHITPRGLPEDLAYASRSDSRLYISDGDGEEEGMCSAAQAERWVLNGSSVYEPSNNGKPSFVTNPDWHSHSWLTPDEFELALAAYLKASGFQINTPRLPAPEEMALMTSTGSDGMYALESITEYWAILAALRCFELQGHQARLVFWFDN